VWSGSDSASASESDSEAESDSEPEYRAALRRWARSNGRAGCSILSTTLSIRESPGGSGAAVIPSRLPRMLTPGSLGAVVQSISALQERGRRLVPVRRRQPARRARAETPARARTPVSKNPGAEAETETEPDDSGRGRFRARGGQRRQTTEGRRGALVTTGAPQVFGPQFRSFSAKRRNFGPGTGHLRAALESLDQVCAMNWRLLLDLRPSARPLFVIPTSDFRILTTVTTRGNIY